MEPNLGNLGRNETYPETDLILHEENFIFNSTSIYSVHQHFLIIEEGYEPQQKPNPLQKPRRRRLLTALVAAFALLSVGAGWATFSTIGARFSAWDVLFVINLATFLVLFLRLIVSHAASSVMSSKTRSSDGRRDSPR